MAALRLTSANLEFVKRQLRRECPEIKSSHLTEALAAALGHKTHAALIAHMAGKGMNAEPVIRLQGERWTERLSELGHRHGHADRLTAFARLPDLPDPCWREVPKGDRTALDKWFYHCRANALPFVFIRPARKYATLEWDCITVNSDNDGRVRGDESRALVKALYATFQRHAKGETGKPMFNGSAFVGAIERLLPCTAASLADEFFMALYEATRALVPRKGVVSSSLATRPEDNG